MNDTIYAVIIGAITVFGSIAAAIIASRAAVEAAIKQPVSKTPLDQSKTIETQARTIERLANQVDKLQKDFNQQNEVINQIKKGRLHGTFDIDINDLPSASISVQYQNAE